MKRVFLLIVLAAAAIAGRAQQITGTWSGKAKITAETELEFIFHIEKEGELYTAKMDIPAQGAKGLPFSEATFERDTLRLAVRQIDFVYTGVLRDEAIEGSFSQRGYNFALDLTRGGIVYNRPQEPRPPFPYRSEDITFENREAGITLAGTLTMPSGGGNFPAAVLLTGSGAQDRNEELRGHKPFLVLSDYLTRRGIAVLRCDDRGVGGSGGDPAVSTTGDHATDAAAALEYLRTRGEIDHTKMGFIGHSEGGMTAFITAANHPGQVAFIVSMAGPGVMGSEIMNEQFGDALAASGLSDSEVAEMKAMDRRYMEMTLNSTVEYVAAHVDDIAASANPGFDSLGEEYKTLARRRIAVFNIPWMRFFLSHDTRGDLAKIECPVLALNGDNDVQVRSAANLAAIRDGLAAGGNPDVTVIEYPRLNHLFQTSTTGGMEEYLRIEETIAPVVLEDIAEWILSRTAK
jgi:pimeloyl-ACP methyl ester carboxylesterase